MTSTKRNLSAILLSLVTMLFFVYLSWMWFDLHAILRAFSMLSIVVLFGWNTWKQIRKQANATLIEHWIFILIAFIFWMAHSLIYGSLSQIGR